MLLERGDIWMGKIYLMLPALPEQWQDMCPQWSVWLMWNECDANLGQKLVRRNACFISKEHWFQRRLKSDINWNWHSSFIRKLQKDGFVRQLFILHSLHFHIVLRPVPKTYFLKLTASPNSAVTTWWEGLTFVGWYKGSKIKLNFFWQCSCLVTLPASPTYHDDVYTSSLVYVSIHLLIPNIFILPAAHSALISAGCVAVHLSGHNWTDAHKILRRKVIQPTATNTEHINVSSLSSFPSLSPFQISLVLQAFGNKGTPCLGKSKCHFCFGTGTRCWWHDKPQSTRVCLCIVNVVQGDPQQSCSVVGWRGVCKGNLSPMPSAAIDWWPSGSSGWNDLVDGLDASCLPLAQQTGLVDQTAQLGLFGGGGVCFGEMWMEASAGILLWRPTCGGRCWVAAGPPPTSPHQCLLKWLVRCRGSSTARWWRGTKCKQRWHPRNGGSSAGRIWPSNVCTGTAAPVQRTVSCL